MVGNCTLRRRGVGEQYRLPIVEGDVTRDWAITEPVVSLWPYNRVSLRAEPQREVVTMLWPYKAPLSSRVAYGQTQLERKLTWFEYSMFFVKRFRVPLAIAFAFVATHNHFVLDRGGKVFKQTAPVIKLPEGATEDDHLALLGVLNSSTACFWLKQNSQNKGNGGIGGGIGDEAWEPRYEFTGATLEDYPLPFGFPLERARLLDDLARDLAAHKPSAVCAAATPNAEALAVARKASDEIHARMIAIQEELDWEVYRLYGLIDTSMTYGGDDLPRLALGERAFEIALARAVRDGEEETVWFTRHGSAPISEIPEHWSAVYRDLIQKRLDLIASHPSIRLLEKPEYKRRWVQESWEKRQERALRNWLLDRLEDRRFWFDGQGRPMPRSVAQLADDVTRDADMVSVFALWEGRPDVPVTDSLVRLLADEAVPFLASYRYKDSGLRKREGWEETWALQRREDAQCRLAYFDHAAVLIFALARMGLASWMVAGPSWRVPCWPGFLTG